MGTRFSAPVQTGPGSHPASCTVGTGSFTEVKSGRGVTLTPQPLLVPRSRKSRAITLLSLWAVRPVECISASTRVHFNFTFYLTEEIISIPNLKVRPLSRHSAHILSNEMSALYISTKYCQHGTSVTNIVSTVNQYQILSAW